MPSGVIWAMASPTLPISLNKSQKQIEMIYEGRGEELYLNIRDLCEIKFGSAIEEAQVNAIGIPAVLDDVVGKTIEGVLGFSPPVSFHLLIICEI